MGEVLRASLRSPPLDEEPGNEVVVLNGLLTLGENPRGGSLMLPRTAGETEGFHVCVWWSVTSNGPEIQMKELTHQQQAIDSCLLAMTSLDRLDYQDQDESKSSLLPTTAPADVCSTRACSSWPNAASVPIGAWTSNSGDDTLWSTIHT